MTNHDIAHDDSGLNDAVIRVLNRLPAHQAIIVIVGEGFKADLYLYEQCAGEWRRCGQMPANIGLNGIGKSKEGDQKSPTGIFSLGFAFGLLPKPKGARYPYRLLTPEDYWVDDSGSKEYNQWVHYLEGEPKDWRSAEQLWNETICYRYALVINYNTGREPGKGSAIFLHVWRNEDTPTHGCTAVSEENMVRILQWLNPEEAPVLIQGDVELYFQPKI